MLIEISSFDGLNRQRLMAIYEEGNRENAAMHYPDTPPGVGLTMAEQDFLYYLREDFFKVPGAFYAIWAENDLWVSALRMEPYNDGYLLEALETHPEHRGKGYAKKLVNQVQQMVDATIYSHVSKKNGASLTVHKACGFQTALNYAVYLDGSVSRGAITLRYDK